MNDRLDYYQTALLAGLREHVTEQPRPAEAPGRRAPSRRLALVAAGTVVAAGTGLVLLPGVGARPAYSVTEGNGGEIIVRVDRPEDAEGLEAALAERGVAADVTYLEWPWECAPGRYAAASGRDTSLSVGNDLLEVTLEPGAVREGDTFVLSLAHRGEESMSSAIVEFDVAIGPVAACRPVLGGD